MFPDMLHCLFHLAYSVGGVSDTLVSKLLEADSLAARGTHGDYGSTRVISNPEIEETWRRVPATPSRSTTVGCCTRTRGRVGKCFSLREAHSRCLTLATHANMICKGRVLRAMVLQHFHGESLAALLISATKLPLEGPVVSFRGDFRPNDEDLQQGFR